MFLALLSLIVAGLLASTAAATTTRIAFTETETCVATGAPAAQWLSGDVLHVRGLPEQCQVVGNLGSSTNNITVNFNRNTLTGQQEFWGTFHSLYTSGPFAGSGSTGIWTTNLIVGHGFGELDGWVVHAHFVNGFAGDAGYLMSPGDK
jgi:hypothetical protein